jgi:hypothetical protein
VVWNYVLAKQCKGKPVRHGGLAIAAVLVVQSKGWVESCPPGGGAPR